ncbi:hypothetical protein [Streptomyces sp. CAU 1734]|uniref:hypothetical protein n=1 Tax=Streptomyces sp. CAU 1734 TaxID=3140360 RepID=UPI0032611609
MTLTTLDPIPHAPARPAPAGPDPLRLDPIWDRVDRTHARPDENSTRRAEEEVLLRALAPAAAN